MTILNKLKEKTRDAFQETKDAIQETTEALKEKTKDALQETKEALKEKTKDAFNETKEALKEKTDALKEKKGSLVDGAATKVLDSFARSYLNNYLDGIMEMHEIKLVRTRPVITFSLEGIPEYIHTAEVCKIEISDDGHTVTLGEFRCNTPCIENALNKFAARSYTVDDDKAALALVGVRKVLL